MSLVVTFIGELPVRIGAENVFVNAWSYENVFVAGDDGAAYRDAGKQIRINPRLMLEDFDAVVARVNTLGGGKWTVEQIRTALRPALTNLLGHFEVHRGSLGTIVRVSKLQRARLKGDPNVNREVRIPDEGLGDLGAQNGDDAGGAAREIAERAAMVDLANAVSRVLA
jgi:hypothetical protein